MKKKILFLAFSIIMLSMLTLAACVSEPPVHQFQHEFTMTRKIADQILNDYELGDNVFVVDGFAEYGYSITDADNFVAYEKNDDGEECYYGNIDNEYYKVMIDSEENKSYTKLAKWEAIINLMGVKSIIEEYIKYPNNEDILQHLNTFKEAGGDFGKMRVYGNGYWENEGDKIPKNASFKYTINIAERGTAFYFELEYTFQEKMLTAITERNTFAQAYIPDYIRISEAYSTAMTREYIYDRVLTMPQDKGEDVTYNNLVYSLVFLGTDIDYQTGLTRGDKISLPEIDNDAFLGWYYDRNYNFPVGELYEVGYEYDYFYVYAKWQVPALQVRLNAGTLSEQAQSRLAQCVYISDIDEIEPYRQGYSFVGWYADAGFNDAIDSSDYEIITQDSIVYAKWEPLIKITLSADIDYKLPILVGTQGENIPEIEPSKRGAIFAGWYKDKELTIPVTEDTFSASATYYARFEEAICIDINFENALLTVDLPRYINIPLDESELDFEDLIDELSSGYAGISTSDGQYFQGWYLDAALTEPFTSYPAGNITIYPKIAP